MESVWPFTPKSVGVFLIGNLAMMSLRKQSDGACSSPINNSLIFATVLFELH